MAPRKRNRKKGGAANRRDANPALQANADPNSSEKVILHVSDLHFGYDFNEALWDELIGEAIKVKPDVVLLTGDMVNSPWRWKVKQVATRLASFQKKISENRGEVPVCVVPGNHDTRFFGLVPLAWFSILAGISVLSSIWYFVSRGFSWSNPFGNAVAISWVGVAILSAAMRLTMTTSWKKMVPSGFLTENTIFEQLGVGILMFNSSPALQPAANGSVGTNQIGVAKRFIEQRRRDKPSERLIWIAAVHHHPLPLAYDSATERYMVMVNAGTLVRELWRRGVTLIVHGHKHHRRFVRMNAEPETHGFTEIGILAAGSPTKGKTPHFRHSFNVVRIAKGKPLSIEHIEAEGEGTFEQVASVNLTSLEMEQRSRYEDWIGQAKISCRDLICIAKVNRVGDALFVREFRGVSTSLESISEIPTDYGADSEAAHMESMKAEGVSANDPAVFVRVNMALRKRNSIEGRVEFPLPGLRRTDQPANFTLEIVANNAFALNSWQFVNMYPGRAHDAHMESMNFNIHRELAVENLTIHMVFEPGTPLPQGVKASAFEKNGKGSPIPLPESALLRLDSLNAVQIKIPYPVPGAQYQLRWKVPTQARIDGNGRALQLRGKLASATQAQARQELTPALLLMRDAAVLLLTNRSDSVERLAVRLFRYLQDSHELECVASTFPEGDSRQIAKYPFGMGLPGRAFKTAGTIAFKNSNNEFSDQQIGYLHRDGGLVGNPPNIPESEVTARALAVSDAEEWPYAVLELSSEDPTFVINTTDEDILRAMGKEIAGLNTNLQEKIDKLVVKTLLEQ